jgi:hypothetical protein
MLNFYLCLAAALRDQTRSRLSLQMEILASATTIRGMGNAPLSQHSWLCGAYIPTV